jgi:hypothetical protein
LGNLFKKKNLNFWEGWEVQDQGAGECPISLLPRQYHVAASFGREEGHVFTWQKNKSVNPLLQAHLIMVLIHSQGQSSQDLNTS